MIILDDLKNRVLDGEYPGREDALKLTEAPLEALCSAADEIREWFCGSAVELCAIVNAKSGLCSEDCRFCAQSASGNLSAAESYPLEEKRIVDSAVRNYSEGINRFSIVTSGRKMSDDELELICSAVQTIKEKTQLKVCASIGLLEGRQFERLREAGITRIHNNLETSRRFFTQICTTHSYDDKLISIQAAKKAGLEVCSGGIIGLGETIEDRVDMALELRELEAVSVPVNLLNPIPGTPFENNAVTAYDEVRRTVAIYRFILPRAFIRLAGGRGLMPDGGQRCFSSGANAAITGDMLTTHGIRTGDDIVMLKKMGFEVQ